MYFREEKNIRYQLQKNLFFLREGSPRVARGQGRAGPGPGPLGFARRAILRGVPWILGGVPRPKLLVFLKIPLKKYEI